MINLDKKKHIHRMPKNKQELDALMRALLGDAKWEKRLAARIRHSEKGKRRDG